MDRVNEPPRNPAPGSDQPERKPLYPPTPKATAWVGNEMKTEAVLYGAVIEIEGVANETGTGVVQPILFDSTQVVAVYADDREGAVRGKNLATIIQLSAGGKIYAMTSVDSINRALQLAKEHISRATSRAILEDANALIEQVKGAMRACVTLTIEAENREQLEALLQRAAIALDHLNEGNTEVGMPEWRGQVFYPE